MVVRFGTSPASKGKRGHQVSGEGFLPERQFALGSVSPFPITFGHFVGSPYPSIVEEGVGAGLYAGRQAKDEFVFRCRRDVDEIARFPEMRPSKGRCASVRP